MELKKYRWMLENWELVAVVIAGFTGLVLHALGVIHEETILISLILFLLCLYVLRDVSFESANERYNKEMLEKIKNIESRLEESEVELVLPQNIMLKTGEFYSKSKGDVWMFNMCMKMYSKEKETWDTNVMPLVKECKNKDKVNEPIFSEIEEPIAFQMITTGDDKNLREALISIWGEPFMVGHGKDKESHQVHHPRYVFYIKSHSEIIPRLKELFLRYKLTQ